MIDIFNGQIKFISIGISSNDIDKFSINNNRIGAGAEALVEYMKGGRRASQKEDFEGVDRIKNSMKKEKDQVKGYDKIKDNLYAGINIKRGEEKYLHKLEQMIGNDISEPKIEILFEDDKFKEEFKYNLSKLLKYNNEYHIAIDLKTGNNDEEFYFLMSHSKEWLLENCDLLRFRSFCKDLVFDRQKAINRMKEYNKK